MIHICFSLYDKVGSFSKFIGTAMLSLFENTSAQVTVHILHDDTLTQDNREKFFRLAEGCGQLVKFYNVEEFCADKIAEIRNFFPNIDKSIFSVAMFYRFFIPHIFPAEIKKAIYLDADIIVNLDINELWQVELGDQPLAVILEIDNGTPILKYSNMLRDGVVKEENYFNSGVLLINLEVMRKEESNIMAGMKFVGEHPIYNLVDQEILNYCFETRTLKLPVKFNRMVKESRNNGVFFIGKEIYHYAGGRFGLSLKMSDPYNRLWWSYFIRTPWFGVDTLDCIFKGATDCVIQMSFVPHGKSRVFIVDEAYAYQIERNFSVRDAEEIVVVNTESEYSLRNLMELMNASRDKKIFFIGIQNIDQRLKDSGFVEGKDFFNVCEFYSPVWSNRVNNHNLILSM